MSKQWLTLKSARTTELVTLLCLTAFYLFIASFVLGISFYDDTDYLRSGVLVNRFVYIRAGMDPSVRTLVQVPRTVLSQSRMAVFPFLGTACNLHCPAPCVDENAGCMGLHLPNSLLPIPDRQSICIALRRRDPSFGPLPCARPEAFRILGTGHILRRLFRRGFLPSGVRLRRLPLRDRHNRRAGS